MEQLRRIMILNELLLISNRMIINISARDTEKSAVNVLSNREL